MKRECEKSIEYVAKNRHIMEVSEIREVLLATNDAFDIFGQRGIKDTLDKIDSDELNAFCLAWNHINRCPSPDCLILKEYFQLASPENWGKTSNMIFSKEILDLFKPE